MSLFESFSVNNLFAELNEARDYGSGPVAPATLKARARANLGLTGDQADLVIDTLVFGTDANTGLLGGAGSSGDTYDLGATAGTALDFRLAAAHTTGDMRGLYMHVTGSTTGSGEAVRARYTQTGAGGATGGTINAAHHTLDATGSGAVSGAGNAMRLTVGLGAATTIGGTIAGLQLDSDFNATANIPSGIAPIRVTNSNTGVWPRLLRLPNASNSTIFATHVTDAMSHSIRCITEAGTVFCIMCTTTQTNRGGGAV